MSKKCSDTKVRILALERILMGAQKPLKCDEIIDRLYKRYHISANRKTIYDDIAVLTCFVNVKHCRHGGYWVEKDGENSESNEAIGFYDECCCEGLKYLEKPPQSWRYVDYPEKEM